MASVFHLTGEVVRMQVIFFWLNVRNLSGDGSAISREELSGLRKGLAYDYQAVGTEERVAFFTG